MDRISIQPLFTTPAHIMVVEESGSGRVDVDEFFTISDVDHSQFAILWIGSQAASCCQSTSLKEILKEKLPLHLKDA
ncbi:hypothetical protein R1flu_001988 [Riccia fluitans]|uniref:Uncharacterized protein n=1 Tax=Riccia fluitans TaxID=41844 RepID=A0ABD1Y537_9MARC